MSVTSVSGATSSATTSTSSTSSTDSMISPDAFLTMLMTQLKYQDPMDPMDTTEFMGQLAQLTQVQLTQTMSDNISSLVSANKSNTLSQWSDIIGKSISVDGNAVSTGDSIVLTPSGDYDSIVLKLTNSAGTVTQQTVSKGDSLTLAYSGTEDVTVSAYALKNNKTVGCTVGVYQTVTGVQTDTDGAVIAVTSNGNQHKVSTITKIIS
jgi:flagellar basal-body rod modification protein FlgD